MTIKPIAAALGLAGFFAALYAAPVHAAPANGPALQMMAVADKNTVQHVKVADKAVSTGIKIDQKPDQNTQQKTQKVEDGDTLSSIAEDNQTTYVRIYDANSVIDDPDVIHPGDELRIPADDEQLQDRPMPASATGVPQPAVDTSQPAAAEAPAPQVPASPSAVADGSVWDELAQCESHGNWSIDTGNGFYGGLQFTLATWQGLGGTGYPNQSSRETQIVMAEKLLARSGWGNWPACSAQLGLR